MYDHIVGMAHIIGFYTDYNFVFNLKKNRFTTSTQLYILYVTHCHIIIFIDITISAG